MELGISLEFSDFFDRKWSSAISSELDIDFFQLNVTEEMLCNDYGCLLRFIVATEKRIVLHAPRINLSKKEDFIHNESILCSTIKLADRLSSEIIVIHPGNGSILETIYQLNIFFDYRLAVENLPYSICNNNGVCPKQIQYIANNTGVKFCLDFSHAICSANFLNKNIYDTLSEYNELNPVLYHFSDGFIEDVKDKHLHLGKGNYDLVRILNSFVPQNSSLILETGVFDNCRDPNCFINDVKLMRRIIGGN